MSPTPSQATVVGRTDPSWMTPSVCLILSGSLCASFFPCVCCHCLHCANVLSLCEPATVAADAAEGIRGVSDERQEARRFALPRSRCKAKGGRIGHRLGIFFLLEKAGSGSLRRHRHLAPESLLVHATTAVHLRRNPGIPRHPRGSEEPLWRSPSFSAGRVHWL